MCSAFIHTDCHCSTPIAIKFELLVSNISIESVIILWISSLRNKYALKICQSIIGMRVWGCYDVNEKWKGDYKKLFWKGISTCFHAFKQVIYKPNAKDNKWANLKIRNKTLSSMTVNISELILHYLDHNGRSSFFMKYYENC